MEVKRRLILVLAIVALITMIFVIFWRSPEISAGSPTEVSVTIQDNALDHVLDNTIDQMKSHMKKSTSSRGTIPGDPANKPSTTKADSKINTPKQPETKE